MNDKLLEFTKNTFYATTDGGYPIIKNHKNQIYNFVGCSSIKMLNHEHAQCKILKGNDGSYTLRSYNTLVAHITSNGYISCNGVYSRTTINHISWFAKFINIIYELEVPISYYSFKECWENDIAYNVFSGEIVEL